MIAAHIPYIIDSNVNGFPSAKKAMIVAPSWLKRGFIIAMTSTIGITKIRFFLNEALPFRNAEKHNAHKSDITRQTGFIKNIEKTIANKK